MLGVGVGVGTGTVDGVADGVGTGLGVGVADGVGSGVADGVGTGAGVTDGVGVGVGVGVGTGLGAGVGSGLGVGVGVGATGVVPNPASPPDSLLTILATTSQDLSWEVMVAESFHGPGSVELTAMFKLNRAFSPSFNLILRTTLSLAQLAISGSWNLMYFG